MARQEQLLAQQLDHADKMGRLAEGMHNRQAELLLLVKTTYPKYEAVVAATRKAKADFEAALSTRLGGRRVNLMGDFASL